MAQPNIAQVQIGSNKFRAVGVHFGMSTLHNHAGMPSMGSLACSIAVVVDLNDTDNMPFGMLSAIFGLANGMTKEKIQEIALTFWKDDAAQDVICTYKFRGWISNYVTATGASRSNSDTSGGSSSPANHVLTLTLQPEVDAKNFVNIQIGN